MPQPAENRAAAEQLIEVYRATHQRLTAELAATFGDATKGVRRRKVNELLRFVDTQIDGLQAAIREWAGTTLPVVYGAGAAQAAKAVGTTFEWSQPHVEAVQAFARRVFGEHLARTEFVRDDTKQVVRGLARSATERSLLDGVTPTAVGRELAAEISRATGAATIRYADGTRMPLSAYADMAVRTDTARAYNSGTVTQAREDGFDSVELVDGPDCGFTEHDDPDLADGSVRSLADFEEYPISHPGCARSAFPVAGGAEIDGGG